MTPPRRLKTTLLAFGLCIALSGTSITQHVAAAQGTYVVQPNDTLSSIALRFGTSVAALAAANNIANADQIFVGETLQLSTDAASPAAVASVSSIYVVQPGDTLSLISQRYGVSLFSLASINGIANPSQIVVGQHLALPEVGGGSSTPSQSFTPATQIGAASNGTYVVQPGDTLFAISQRYGITLDSLTAANNLSVQSVLSVGEQLTIPGAASSTAASSVVDTSATSLVSAPVDQGTIGSILSSQALAAGVDPSLVKAVAWQESGWQMVTASDGGMGVMQLMPDAVDWVSNSLLGYQINPYDPTDNIRAGVAMLRYFLQKYGDVSLALAAYHQGMGSLQSDGILPETQGYINNILALQQRFSA